MADITSNDKVLKVENLFVDGDTRTFTIKNPSDSITTADIQNLSNYMRDNNLLIGDKWGGNFGRIVEVKKVTTTRKDLDLS